MIKKLIAILVLSAIAAFPFHASMAGDDSPGRKDTMQFKLGELALRITPAPADGGYQMAFSKGREKLFDCECALKTHEPRTLQHTPSQNCHTLLAYCFSGGAHCCTTLFIATECDSEGSLDMIDLGHSDAEVKFIRTDDAPGRVMKIHDWQFAYYGLENSEIQLSFAHSPSMTRLLVFDNGRWRADRAGEFSQFYSGLLRKTVDEARTSALRSRSELTASLAIQAAYYDLMGGGSVKDAGRILSRFLPEKWKSDSDKIVQDVSRAVIEFNPIEAIN